MPNQHTKKRKAAAATQNDSDAESSTTGGVHDNDIGLGTGKGDVNEPGITLSEQRRRARVLRNRASAQRSRDAKKHYQSDLENRVKLLEGLLEKHHITPPPSSSSSFASSLLLPPPTAISSTSKSISSASTLAPSSSAPADPPAPAPPSAASLALRRALETENVTLKTRVSKLEELVRGLVSVLGRQLESAGAGCAVEGDVIGYAEKESGELGVSVNEKQSFGNLTGGVDWTVEGGIKVEGVDERHWETVKKSQQVEKTRLSQEPSEDEDEFDADQTFTDDRNHLPMPDLTYSPTASSSNNSNPFLSARFGSSASSPANTATLSSTALPPSPRPAFSIESPFPSSAVDAIPLDPYEPLSFTFSPLPSGPSSPLARSPDYSAFLKDDDDMAGGGGSNPLFADLDFSSLPASSYAPSAPVASASTSTCINFPSFSFLPSPSLPSDSTLPARKSPQQRESDRRTTSVGYRRNRVRSMASCNSSGDESDASMMSISSLINSSPATSPEVFTRPIAHPKQLPLLSSMSKPSSTLSNNLPPLPIPSTTMNFLPSSSRPSSHNTPLPLLPPSSRPSSPIPRPSSPFHPSATSKHINKHQHPLLRRTPSTLTISTASSQSPLPTTKPFLPPSRQPTTLPSTTASDPKQTPSTTPPTESAAAAAEARSRASRSGRGRGSRFLNRVLLGSGASPASTAGPSSSGVASTSSSSVPLRAVTGGAGVPGAGGPTRPSSPLTMSV